jgi:hypothetical protein
MDRHTLAILIPVIMMTFTGLIAFSFTRLGKAVAKRIEGGVDDGLLERVRRLEEDNDPLQQALMSAHQRLDDAERVIARNERNVLGGR